MILKGYAMTKEHKVLAALAVLAGVFYWFNLPLPAALTWAAFGLYSMRRILTAAD